MHGLEDSHDPLLDFANVILTKELRDYVAAQCNGSEYAVMTTLRTIGESEDNGGGQEECGRW